MIKLGRKLSRKDSNISLIALDCSKEMRDHACVPAASQLAEVSSLSDCHDACAIDVAATCWSYSQRKRRGGRDEEEEELQEEDELK